MPANAASLNSKYTKYRGGVYFVDSSPTTTIQVEIIATDLRELMTNQKLNTVCVHLFRYFDSRNVRKKLR